MDKRVELQIAAYTLRLCWFYLDQCKKGDDILKAAEFTALTGALGAEVIGVQLAHLVKRNDSSTTEPPV